MITGLNFQPWISDNYAKGTGKYGKLLILGESHYTEEDEEEENKDVEEIDNSYESNTEEENHFTTAIVKGFLDGTNNIAFFRNLGLLFNIGNRKEVWENVAFANGIQVALNSSNAQPTRDQTDTIAKAFWLLVQSLEPDKILVCSKRMWNHWIPEDPKLSKYLKSIQVNKKHSTIWEYEVGNKKCLAMGINHPSKYFSYDNWRPIVFDFLEAKAT